MRKVKLDGKESLQAQNLLFQLMQNLRHSNRNFNMCLNYNFDEFDRLLKPAKKSLTKMPEDYNKFEREKFEIAVLYTDKTAVDYPHEFVPTSDILNKQSYSDEILALKQEFADAIEEAEKIEKENMEFLEKQEFEFEFYEIDPDDIPEGLTPSQQYAVRHFIDPDKIKKQSNEKTPAESRRSRRSERRKKPSAKSK